MALLNQWQSVDCRPPPDHRLTRNPTFLRFVAAVAIKTMNEVASHINEMQKLHEEYGAVFDQLINEQTPDKKEVRVGRSTQTTAFSRRTGGGGF